MNAAIRLYAFVAMLVITFLLTSCASGQSSQPDHSGGLGTDAPAGVARFVDVARRSLEFNEEGPFKSSFEFLEARCREDGGLVIVFNQRDLTGNEGHAYALSGKPTDAIEDWGGAFDVSDINRDADVAAFFEAGAEVDCQ